MLTSVNDCSLDTKTSRKATASEPRLAYIDIGATCNKYITSMNEGTKGGNKERKE